MPLTQQGHSEASKKEKAKSFLSQPGRKPGVFHRAETPPRGGNESSEAGPSPPHGLPGARVCTRRGCSEGKQEREKAKAFSPQKGSGQIT